MTIMRGFETYAVEPHKRRKFTCAVCGHTFVPKEIIKIKPQEEMKCKCTDCVHTFSPKVEVVEKIKKPKNNVKAADLISEA